jgi:hypothetical protein
MIYKIKGKIRFQKEIFESVNLNTDEKINKITKIIGFEKIR